MVSFRAAEQASMDALNKRREQTRQEFFKGNQNISDNRLDRRQIQSDLYEQFKQDQMKPVLDSQGNPTGAYQSITPGGPTLADAAMQLANKYGPTPGEIVGDIGRGLGSMIKGGADFLTSGGITGAVLQGAKDLITKPVDTAKKIGYGVKDMAQGYDPFTKQGIGETQEIKTEPLPSLNLESKMSAYTDPIMYYANKQKVDKPAPVMVADAGNAAQNYMNLLKNIQNLGNTPYGNFGVENIFSNPSLTYEKEIGPGTFSTKIGDNKVQAGYSMIFNKGGRVQGTGIMGAL